MKILKRILWIIGALLLVTVFGTYVDLLTTKPVYSGSVRLPGLKEPVDIFFDNYGVPHIFAKNQEDAYFSLGYVHAQDRLFQMELLRRAAAGRLAEILGPDLVKVDALFRTLGLHRFAKENATRYLGTDTTDFQKEALAYQRGINQYIKSGKTPIEFTIIGIPKEEFKPEDIYLAIGFMSFTFAEGLRADPVLEKIKSEWGYDYLADLAVQTPPDAIRLKNFSGEVKPSTSKELISAIGKALDYLPIPLWEGSNGMVISGKRTASGFPILENDTHIEFAQPAVWYEASIHYPGFDFYGHHLAGIPFGVLGNTARTAWGLTIFENDDTDFFVEKRNPSNTEQVKFKGQWENLTLHKEIIKVKGQADFELNVRSSRHGPIINGIVSNTSQSQPIALSWTLLQHPSETVKALYLLNHSYRLTDIEKAASIIAAPGVNLMYGDADGNIAWWAVAKLPIRPDHVDSKLFLDGSTGDDEYLGYYRFDKNPHAVNPPWGFVYSANNQPDTVAGILYPGYYYPRDRASRIVELLSQDKKWTPEDLKEVDLDVISTVAPSVAKEIAAVLKAAQEPAFEDLIHILENWNGDHQIKDAGPTVYYNLLAQIMSMSMKDELGTEAFETLMTTSVAKGSYLSLIRHEESPWWDDVRTKKITETRSVIFKKAAFRTLDILKETCGKNPAAWTWGHVHRLTHNHPLGKVKPLDKFFNVGPFTVAGGSEVINNLHFHLDTTGIFTVNGGPALRKITDFSNRGAGETISPTGQSGNVMSKHYDDQAEMFASGKFRPMLFHREEIEKASKDKLTLLPIH
jgi:penicillin G amidase